MRNIGWTQCHRHQAGQNFSSFCKMPQILSHLAHQNSSSHLPAWQDSLFCRASWMKQRVYVPIRQNQRDLHPIFRFWISFGRPPINPVFRRSKSSCQVNYVHMNAYYIQIDLDVCARTHAWSCHVYKRFHVCKEYLQLQPPEDKGVRNWPTKRG